MAETDKVAVPATQYRLPDGSPFEGHFMLPADAAKLVLAHGFKLSTELLGDSEVATYCRYGPDDEDEDISVTENGPAVTEKLAEMIRRCAERVGGDHG